MSGSLEKVKEDKGGGKEVEVRGMGDDWVERSELGGLRRVQDITGVS